MKKIIVLLEIVLVVIIAIIKMIDTNDSISLKPFISNLNKEIGKIEGNSRKGLISAARFLKLEAMSRAPHDTGNLKDTAFHVLNQKNGNDVETIGFTAPYAAPVHEMTGKLKGQPRANFGKTAAGVEFGGGTGKGHYWDQGEPHFLTKAFVENFTTILNIIRKFASKK